MSAATAFCEARAVTDCVYHVVPAETLADIPIVQWELLETFHRRLRSFRTGYRFEWFPFFSVGVGSIDAEHKTLFAIMDELAEAMEDSGRISGNDGVKQKLLEFTRSHFQNEEALMEKYSYARLPVRQRSDAHGRGRAWRSTS